MDPWKIWSVTGIAVVAILGSTAMQLQAIGPTDRDAIAPDAQKSAPVAVSETIAPVADSQMPNYIGYIPHASHFIPRSTFTQTSLRTVTPIAYVSQELFSDKNVELATDDVAEVVDITGEIAASDFAEPIANSYVYTDYSHLPQRVGISFALAQLDTSIQNTTDFGEVIPFDGAVLTDFITDMTSNELAVNVMMNNIDQQIEIQQNTIFLNVGDLPLGLSLDATNTLGYQQNYVQMASLGDDYKTGAVENSVPQASNVLGRLNYNEIVNSKQIMDEISSVRSQANEELLIRAQMQAQQARDDAILTQGLTVRY